MKRAVELYKTLYDQSPAESINYTWFDAGTRYSEGDIGMFYWWSAYFTLVNGKGYMTGEPSVVKDDFGIVPCPRDGDRAVDGAELERMGVKLDRLNRKQASYLGIPADGPYKPEHYRY